MRILLGIQIKYRNISFRAIREGKGLAKPVYNRKVVSLDEQVISMDGVIQYYKWLSLEEIGGRRVQFIILLLLLLTAG